MPTDVGHDLAADLEFALQLADASDVVTMRHYRARTLVVERKPDKTEVTVADRDTESVIRDMLRQHRPADGILGEEHGTIAGTNGCRWIVDPIDGTSNYVRGVPLWATLIALERDGQLVVGVASCPALGKRWWGGVGLGAFVNGEAMHVSGIAALDESFLSYVESPSWDDKGFRAGITELRQGVHRERAFGDFWQHMLVAEGAIDVAVEAVVSLWDLAAVQVIVEAAGGTFTDLHGDARADRGSAVSTNGLLHQQVLKVLGQ
jgi:histidinol-phosphatase